MGLSARKRSGAVASELEKHTLEERESKQADMEVDKAGDKDKDSTVAQPVRTLDRLWAMVDLNIAATMLFNFFSSTGIVSANKYVFNRCGFEFATTLTFIHFIFTTLGLLLCAWLSLFQPKKLETQKAAWLAFVGMGFVVFSNLSLQYNSVGFYQVMKHMTVAAVVAIEAIFYKKYLDKALWIPLSLVIIGVSLTGATDFKLNKIGTIFAVLNILCTCFYQIWCGSLQKSLEANPLQLQLYTAPLSALFILPFIPIMDNYMPSSAESIFHYDFTSKSLMAISVTGLLAFGVNVSIFMVIGKTSAVTYNVLGHFKTVTLLLVDYVYYNKPFEIKNFLGIVITLCGVVSYSHVKIVKSQQNQTQASK